MKEKLMSVERANKLLFKFLAEGKKGQLLNNLTAVMNSNKKYAMSFFEEGIKHFDILKDIAEDFLLVALANKNVSLEKIIRLLNDSGKFDELRYLVFFAKEVHGNEDEQALQIDMMNTELYYDTYRQNLKKLLNLPSMNFQTSFIDYLLDEFNGRDEDIRFIEILDTSSYKLSDIERLIEVGCIEPCNVITCSDRFTEEFLNKYKDELIPFYLDTEKVDSELISKIFE